VAALAFLALYDLVENYLLSPIVYRKTVGVSAVGQILAVLFLGYHLGVVGAVLAIPLAATAQIIVRTLRSPADTTSPRAGATPADSTGPRTPAEPAASSTEGEAPEGPRPQREAPWNGPSGR
jgi:hypothetical protein